MPNLVNMSNHTKTFGEVIGASVLFLTFDLLTLKVVSESSVTYVGYLALCLF